MEVHNKDKVYNQNYIDVGGLLTTIYLTTSTASLFKEVTAVLLLYALSLCQGPRTSSLLNDGWIVSMLSWELRPKKFPFKAPTLVKYGEIVQDLGGGAIVGKFMIRLFDFKTSKPRLHALGQNPW